MPKKNPQFLSSMFGKNGIHSEYIFENQDISSVIFFFLILLLSSYGDRTVSPFVNQGPCMYGILMIYFICGWQQKHINFVHKLGSDCFVQSFLHRLYRLFTTQWHAILRFRGEPGTILIWLTLFANGLYQHHRTNTQTVCTKWLYFVVDLFAETCTSDKL